MRSIINLVGGVTMKLWYVVPGGYVFETMQDAIDYCRAEHIGESGIWLEQAMD